MPKMTTPQSLDAIESALKAGEARSIKAQKEIYAAAFEGLRALRLEKRIGVRRVIRALRIEAEYPLGPLGDT
jgi:hypothetical protein